MTLMKPSEILDTANDIVSFAKRDDVSEADKQKILKMLQDHYNDLNETIVHQWMSQLIGRTLDKHFPDTDIEKSNE